MTPRSDLVQRSAPFLPAGSQIRQAFICQAAPSFAFFLITYATGLTMFWIKYRCVAVTQDAIYVLDSSRLSGGARPTSIVGALPRHTQLGPVTGRWGQLDLLGERQWVHKRFHAEIAAADADAGFTYPALGTFIGPAGMSGSAPNCPSPPGTCCEFEFHGYRDSRAGRRLGDYPPSAGEMAVVSVSAG